MGSYGFRETVYCAGVTSVNINALKASKGISSIKNINALKASEGIHSIRTIQTMCSLELMAAFRVPHCRLSSRTSRYITWGMEEELQQLAKPSASILDHDGGIPVNGTCQKESLQLQDDNCAYQLSLSTNKITEDSPSVSMVQHVIDAFVDKTFSFNIVKIAALTGIFSLQEYYQAWASTEIASSIQTVSWLGDLGDISTGCTSAFLLIFFSELGDKTFFIAALLASRKSNAAVFIGTFGALAAMTIISVFLGRTFHYVDGILPFRLGEIELPLDDLAAVGLLVYFGVSTLLEASSGDGSKANDEQEEVFIS